MGTVMDSHLIGTLLTDILPQTDYRDCNEVTFNWNPLDIHIVTDRLSSTMKTSGIQRTKIFFQLI
jgi:hypothetical protein